MKKVIDNKIVDITKEEYSMYQAICKAYDRENLQGKDLFRDHFITNEHGIIVQVIPKPEHLTNLEVFTFLVSIMTNQHLRLMHQQVETFIEEAKEKIFETISKIKKSS